MNQSRRLALLPSLIGVLLRIGIALALLVMNPDEPDLGALLFWAGLTAVSCVPFAVTYLLTQSNPVRGVVAASAALAGEIFAVITGVILPTGSTSSLILLFMPFWNLLLLIPLAYFLTTIVQRLKRHSSDVD